jgi:hemerythrin superfamily protein
MATQAEDGAKTRTPPRKPRTSTAKARAAKPRVASTAKARNGATNGAASSPTLRKRASAVAGSVRETAASAAGTVQHAAEAAIKSVKGALPARQRKASSKSAGTSTGKVLGIAAAGIAAGLAVNLGRKAAVQAPSALAGDWFEALKGEHKAALALFDALGATADGQTHRRSVLLMQLKHALFKHAATEENVIYPALREAGEKGEADKLNHEHGYVKDYLYQLENMEKNDPGFLMKLSAFRTDLEAHIREEENEVFPSLHARMAGPKNKALTLAANKEGFKAA